MSSGEYGGRELERPGSPLLSWLPLKPASTLQRQDSVPRERVLEAWVYVGHEHDAWSLSSLRLSHCLSSPEAPRALGGWDGSRDRDRQPPRWSQHRGQHITNGDESEVPGPPGRRFHRAKVLKAKAHYPNTWARRQGHCRSRKVCVLELLSP